MQRNILMAGAALCALALASPAQAANTIVCPEHTTCIVPDNQPPPPPPTVQYVPVPTTPGYAAPTPVETPPTFSMFCRRIWNSPYGVSVGSWVSGRQPYQMSVVWSIAEGTFSRRDQYHNVQVGGDGSFAWWTGVWNNDPAHTTRGEANFFNMSYREFHYTNGILDAPTREDPNPQVVRACTRS